MPVTALETTNQKNIRSLCAASDCLAVSTGGEDVVKRHKEAKCGIIFIAFLGVILVCEGISTYLQK
jgi:hypothetical protein